MLRQVAIFLAIGYFFVFADQEYRTNQQQLLSTLFNEEYYKLVRPSKQVNVSLFIGTVALLDVEPDHNRMKAMIFHGLKWFDGRLTWNPENFAGVNEIVIPIEDLWVPDVRILNDANLENPGLFNDHHNAVAWVYSNGTVYHNAEKIATIPMKSNGEDVLIRYCSWSFTRDELLLKGERIGEAFDSLNPKWHISHGSLEDGELHATCCVNPFATVQLNFKVDKN